MRPKPSTGKQSGMDKSRFCPVSLGTIVMIVGLLIFGGWKVLVPSKVTVERTIEASGEPRVKRQASIEDLLSWSLELELAEAQKQSLKELLKKEHLELKPVEDKITTVTEDFNKFVQGSNNQQVSIPEIKGAASAIAPLSIRKRQIITDYSAAGWSVLTPYQKKLAGKFAKAKSTQLSIDSQSVCEEQATAK